ncbi:FliI/YscN family ATPase [Luteibacter sp. CQ10]|uniref:FliI/YscN family ATPase n=1 Tax=Luteibacter sp. CQ10 TaxID=2805821 RepID=UPI0034A4BA9A
MTTAESVKEGGKVVRVAGTVLHVVGIHARVGDLCRLWPPGADEATFGEVVGFDGERTVVTPIGSLLGVSPLTRVEAMGHGLRVPHGRDLLGRVVDGFCRPLDGGPEIGRRVREVRGDVASPLSRPPIDQPFRTGVRAIDGMLPLGVGQRVGVFAGAGAGKTTLIGAITARAEVDAVVIGLIGERGREVSEFLSDAIAPSLRDRSVVVVSTSDRPAAERIGAAHTASAIAESLRDDGRHVLLVVDSLTRFARALREVGLAAGEPPVRRGFPPGVFAELPRLIERAGRTGLGAISALYTVLVEGPEGSDPVSEEVRSLLDGHIVMTTELADAGHFPAIDVLSSRSRVVSRVCSAAHLRRVNDVRGLMSLYRESELLIRLGEYRPGSDAALDRAVRMHDAIDAFLRQDLSDVHPTEREDAAAMLETLLGREA